MHLDIKKIGICIAIGFLCSGLLSVILTPAFETEGNIFDKFGIVSDCISFKRELYISDTTPKVFIGIFIIYIFSIAVYESGKENKRTNEEYGSAKWENVRRICKKYADKDFFKNRLLTQNLKISETGKKIYLNLITLVIGGSGAGKSFYYVIPNLLQAQVSYIVLDPSGELLKRTGGFLKKEGYKIRALNLDELEKSFGYNPFSYLESDDDVLRLVKNIFRATVPRECHSNDPMWDNQAEALCMAYMFLIHYEASEEEKNMRTLMYLAREDVIEEDEDGNIIENAVTALFNKIELENPDHIAVRFRNTAMKGAAKTILGVQTTLMGRLNKFNLESVCRLTDFDEMDLYNIGREKTAMFLVTPAEDKSFNFIVSMFYEQLIPILYRQARKNKNLRLDVPVHFLMDEAANIVLPDDFLTVLTTARKHSISFSVIIQAITQLKDMFPKEQFNTMIGNADEFVYLGSGEFETQKYISERIGKETIIVKSHNLSKGIHGSYSENSQPAARSLLEPSEVDTELGEENALVKIRGNSWIKDRKIDPKSHPNYKYTADVTGKDFEPIGIGRLAAEVKMERGDIEEDIRIDVDELSVELFNRVEIITEDMLERGA